MRPIASLQGDGSDTRTLLEASWAGLEVVALPTWTLASPSASCGQRLRAGIEAGLAGLVHISAKPQEEEKHGAI